MIEKQKIIQGRKFAQVCEGATRVFLRDGYAGASVNDISAAAGVSKATLYSYFPDKRLMFEEVIRNRIAQIAEHSPLDVPEGATAREALPLLAQQIAEWLVSPANLRLYRLQVAEATRFPALAQAYHAAVTTVLHDPLRMRLERWIADGQLRPQESTLAADQFIRLVGAEFHEAVLLGAAAPASEDVVRIAKSAAGIFLACYAVIDGSALPVAGERTGAESASRQAMR